MADRKTFATFRTAAEFARATARRTQQTVSVARYGTQWTTSVVTEGVRHMENENADGDYIEDDVLSDNERLFDYDQEFDELKSEFASTQDDAARSSEDGWYYED